jgi:hypothetical protein
LLEGTAKERSKLPGTIGRHLHAQPAKIFLHLRHRQDDVLTAMQELDDVGVALPPV